MGKHTKIQKYSEIENTRIRDIFQIMDIYFIIIVALVLVKDLNYIPVFKITNPFEM